jgi:hypothetical protein
LPGNADTAGIFHVVLSEFGMIRSTGLLQAGKVRGSGAPGPSKEFQGNVQLQFSTDGEPCKLFAKESCISQKFPALQQASGQVFRQRYLPD